MSEAEENPEEATAFVEEGTAASVEYAELPSFPERRKDEEIVGRNLVVSARDDEGALKCLERATLWGGRPQEKGGSTLSMSPARSTEESPTRRPTLPNDVQVSFNSDFNENEKENEARVLLRRPACSHEVMTYETLSEALRDAQPGDEILLQGGVHTQSEPLVLRTEGVTIKPNPDRDSCAMVEIVLTSTDATLLCLAANIRIENLRIVQASQAGAAP